jgi:hypothetical protein
MQTHHIDVDSINRRPNSGYVAPEPIDTLTCISPKSKLLSDQKALQRQNVISLQTIQQ